MRKGSKMRFICIGTLKGTSRNADEREPGREFLRTLPRIEGSLLAQARRRKKEQQKVQQGAPASFNGVSEKSGEA